MDAEGNILQAVALLEGKKKPGLNNNVARRGRRDKEEGEEQEPPTA